ncbi:hypothetical protein [Rhizorhapis suberifaciens]|uniref:Uncharacterized protein n=1 Tax=Rhizorhapis suberifaciens TaxID=13656 RepID=A0A840HX89_9SPHN|nr:hypothetical protein [Rhizorhapis suberifaciens]MBB4642705.1 hypothetical protein [Rhizorhapis suberifaciens]
MEPLHIGLAEHCRLQRNHNGQAALWLYAGRTLDGDRPVIGVALLSDTALTELSKALNGEDAGTP